MKKIYLLLFIPFAGVSQENAAETKNVEKLIHIWGLVKYFHPEASRGKCDMNAEFLREAEKIAGMTASDAEAELRSWIDRVGSGKSIPARNLSKETNFHPHADLSWIETSGFNPELSSLLIKLKNGEPKNHYASLDANRYPDFRNEKPLKDFDPAKTGHRLLYLASYWNVIQYWDVNHYLAAKPWNQVLAQMIPLFLDAAPGAFARAKEQLFTQLRDSHCDENGSYHYSETLESLHNIAGFGGRIVNDSLVITRIFEPEKADRDGIGLRDVITAIEGVPLREYYIRTFSPVVTASNENHLRKSIEKAFILASTGDSLQVDVVRKGLANTQYIHLSAVGPSEKYRRQRNPKPEKNWKFLRSDIGYLNLSQITGKEVRDAFAAFAATKGIVIDLRNYPSGIQMEELVKYLYPVRTEYMKMLAPSLPGLGEYDGSKSLVARVVNPFAAGSKNADFYKGKVILLVDRSTMSKAEWMGMAIQAAPNCVTLGEQTAGAVMNRKAVPMMDGATMDYTCFGAFYPNGESTQGKGLRIDHTVTESALHFNPGLYIEEAIRVIDGR